MISSHCKLMKAFNHSHASQQRTLIPLPGNPSASYICDIYNGLKHCPPEAVIRAEASGQGWVVFQAKKETTISALAKSSGVQRRREALMSLLTRLGDEYAQETALNHDQQKALDRLRRLTKSKDGAADITAGNLRNLLRPLSNSVRARKLRSATPTSPDARAVGRRQFTVADDAGKFREFIQLDQPTRYLLKVALFGHASESLSLASQRYIVSAAFDLVAKILAGSGSRESIIRLIRASPDTEALLRFAQAWQSGMTDKPGAAGKALADMPWKSAIGRLSVLILRALAKSDDKAVASPRKASPQKTSPVHSPLYAKTLQKALQMSMPVSVPGTVPVYQRASLPSGFSERLFAQDENSGSRVSLNAAEKAPVPVAQRASAEWPVSEKS